MIWPTWNFGDWIHFFGETLNFNWFSAEQIWLNHVIPGWSSLFSIKNWYLSHLFLILNMVKSLVFYCWPRHVQCIPGWWPGLHDPNLARHVLSELERWRDARGPRVSGRCWKGHLLSIYGLWINIVMDDEHMGIYLIICIYIYIYTYTYGYMDI